MTKKLWKVPLRRTALQANEKGRCLFTELDPFYSGKLPDQLDFPFRYAPHPVAVLAANQLRDELTREQPVWIQHHHDFGLLVQLELDGIDNAHTTEKKSTIEAKDDAVGKMFGVLVVQTKTTPQRIGYLKAFSGSLQMDSTPPGFCPMIYDRSELGDSYQQGEGQLDSYNQQISALEESPILQTLRATLLRVTTEAEQELAQAKLLQKEHKEVQRLAREELQIQGQQTSEDFQQLLQEGAAMQRQAKALKAHHKASIATAQSQQLNELERPIAALELAHKTLSVELQDRLFEQYQFLNKAGESKSAVDIFQATPLVRPPEGAGDCAAPKLFQYAFQHDLEPIALAEFWWGKPPAALSGGVIRKHNFYYPCCRGLCEPILMDHMLHGLNVASDPLEQMVNSSKSVKLEIIYEDDVMVVVNKPPDVLSVPGRHIEQSIYSEMKDRYPNATGPLLVHRLDLSTSGVLIVAKDNDSHKTIQAQFINRTVTKRYTALLEGEVGKDVPANGKIDLPLVMDYLNRPMQKVDFDPKSGSKSAVTMYEIIEIKDGRTRIHLYPFTGRTHQLRVHAAHELGLNIPIVGDDIYGQRSDRLHLHAGFLQLAHPSSGKRMTFEAGAPF